MTLLPLDSETLDRASLVSLVTRQAGLEKSLYEFKAEVGNGNRIVETVAAMANNVGGVVLVGVDEDKVGAERLVGVNPSERDRLKDMCISHLVPPYCPDMHAVEVNDQGEVVLVLFVDPDNARRPVMVVGSGKIPIRSEGGNSPADWYRLRELFFEVAGMEEVPLAVGRSLLQLPLYDVDEPFPDLAFRLFVRLTGSTGRPARITEVGRHELLAALNQGMSPLTGHDAILRTLGIGSVNQEGWMLAGENHASKVSARWALLAGTTRAIEVRAFLEIPSQPVSRAWATWQLDVLLSPEPVNGVPPRLPLQMTYDLIDSLLATAWGNPGEVVSKSFLGVPLGPPATAELSIASPYAGVSPERRKITEVINFSPARPIVGSQGTFGGAFNAQLDRSLFDPARRQLLSRSWLEDLGTAAGLDGIGHALKGITPLGV